MAITFGSVGDIISICLIVKDLIAALDDSQGSVAEYREVIRELWGLDRALLEVEHLSTTCDDTIELVALCKTAKQAAENCRHSIESFTAKWKEYNSTFGVGCGSLNIIRNTVEVRWVSQKEDLASFRAEINAHSSSINMLLATASVKLVKAKDEKLHARLDQSSESQDVLIVEFNNHLKENNNLISVGNAVTTKIADMMRLDWIRQLGSEMKSLMERIFTTNVAIYRAVVTLQASLPGHLERTMIQEPFILEDAIGRMSPVHMQFITSWEAFDAVLELRFKTVQGHKKVKNKQYVLQEHDTRREIDRHLPWDVSFLPGQRIDMSLIFENVEEKVTAQTTCPRCQTASAELQDSDIQCSACRMWYRRITEYNNVEPPPLHATASSRRGDIRFGESSFGAATFGPPRPPKPALSSAKRKLSESNIEEMDDVRKFKRVRIISKKNRMKHVPGPFSLYATTNEESILNPKAQQETEERVARERYEHQASLFGPDHHDTLSSLNKLPWCLRTQRKFAAAEHLFRAAFNIHKESPIHGDLKELHNSANNLMTVLVDQNKEMEADELYQVASIIFRSKLDQSRADALLQRLRAKKRIWDPADHLEASRFGASYRRRRRAGFKQAKFTLLGDLLRDRLTIPDGGSKIWTN